MGETLHFSIAEKIPLGAKLKTRLEASIPAIRKLFKSQVLGTESFNFPNYQA